MLALKLKSLVLVTSLLFIGCGGGENVAPQSQKNTVDISKITNQQILMAINEARSEARDCHDGAGIVGPARPLTWNQNLYEAAYEHSYDLANSNTFSHEGSGTQYDITGFNNGVASLFNERIASNGYVDFRAIGENIAGGQTSLAEVIQEWLDSPLHCANIMREDFAEVGVAIVVNPDSDYKVYWSQEFGAKKVRLAMEKNEPKEAQ